MYICQPHLPVHPIPSFPSGVHMFVLYICVAISVCFANKVIYTIFLDSTYMPWYTMFVLLFLASFYMTVSRCIHILYLWSPKAYFPHSSVNKESACNAGDPGSIPGSGRSPGEGNGNPLQYSCLRNPIDRGAWQATVHGVKRVGHYLATKLLLRRTLATWCEELTRLKRPWCWERLKASGEGDDRGWDGWMASPTQWTWVWVSSRNQWWTGRPGMLQSMGLQRVRHDCVTELNWRLRHPRLVWTSLDGERSRQVGRSWPSLCVPIREGCEEKSLHWSFPCLPRTLCQVTEWNHMENNLKNTVNGWRRACMSEHKCTGSDTPCQNTWRAVGGLPSCAGEVQVYMHATCLRLFSPASPWATAQQSKAVKIPPIFCTLGYKGRGIFQLRWEVGSK